MLVEKQIGAAKFCWKRFKITYMISEVTEGMFWVQLLRPQGETCLS